MANLQIVGLGLATVDVLIRLHDMPTWERGARLSGLRFDGGGPVATALVAAARLGARVGYVGTAGDDEIGALKLRYLTRDGVDTGRVIVRPGPEEQVILVYVQEGTGERVFSALHGGQHRPLQPQELDRAYITSAPFLHLDGSHLEAALCAARWAHEAGQTVVLDAAKGGWAVSAAMRALVAETDILICGSGFAPALTGERDLWAAGEAALALGPRVVVQTEGEAGSYTVTGSERFHTPAYPVPVTDTTGAGDVFHGAYLVGLLRGWDLQRTAAFASAVAAIKCTQLGGRAGIPTLDAALAFLREHGVDLEKGKP